MHLILQVLKTFQSSILIDMWLLWQLRAPSIRQSHPQNIYPCLSTNIAHRAPSLLYSGSSIQSFVYRLTCCYSNTKRKHTPERKVFQRECETSILEIKFKNLISYCLTILKIPERWEGSGLLRLAIGRG